jgi:hypothetical protein
MKDYIKDDAISNQGRQRPAGPWPSGVLAVLAGICLLAAACGGGSAATAGSTTPQTPYQKSLAYAECMRSHGEPSWPDPQSDGSFNVNVDLSSPQYQAANKACAHLEGGGQAGGAPQQQTFVNEALRYAACMRSHGIANYPDPSVSGDRVTWGFSPASGISTASPQFQSASQACRHLTPSGGSS